MTALPSLPRHAIILAAGESRRMGRPKALLEIDGIALVARHASRFAEAGCDAIVIATRPELVAVVEASVRESPNAIVMAATTSAQSETLRLAVTRIAASAGEDAIVFITPVDVLPPNRDVLHRLAAALDAGADAATPRFEGRGGHPVALRTTSLHAFASSSRTTLRDHLEALGLRRVRIDVDDPRVLSDLDEPADLRRATLPTAS